MPYMKIKYTSNLFKLFKLFIILFFKPYNRSITDLFFGLIFVNQNNTIDSTDFSANYFYLYT